MKGGGGWYGVSRSLGHLSRIVLDPAAVGEAEDEVPMTGDPRQSGSQDACDDHL